MPSNFPKDQPDTDSVLYANPIQQSTMKFHKVEHHYIVSFHSCTNHGLTLYEDLPRLSGFL